MHIHTVYSTGDSSIVSQQTIRLIAEIRHARTVGISDHIEYLKEPVFAEYAAAIKSSGFRLGAEIVNYEDIDYALSLPLEYRVFHCYDEDKYYAAVERLLESGEPLIIAHPMALGTDLGRIPPECFVEINNRYVWRNDWNSFFTPWKERFRFVYSSDAHQPNWLGQNVARHVGAQLGIRETLVFGEGTRECVA